MTSGTDKGKNVMLPGSKCGFHKMFTIFCGKKPSQHMTEVLNTIFMVTGYKQPKNLKMTSDIMITQIKTQSNKNTNLIILPKQ